MKRLIDVLDKQAKAIIDERLSANLYLNEKEDKVNLYYDKNVLINTADDLESTLFNMIEFHKYIDLLNFISNSFIMDYISLPINKFLFKYHVSLEAKGEEDIALYYDSNLIAMININTKIIDCVSCLKEFNMMYKDYKFNNNK